MTRTVSIAEIIGWDCSLAHKGEWVTPTGRRTFAGPTVTVDDMLDWLYKRGYVAEIGSARNEGERDIWCYAHPFGDASAEAELSADGATAAAAVEAIVRQAAMR